MKDKKLVTKELIEMFMLDIKIESYDDIIERYGKCSKCNNMTIFQFEKSNVFIKSKNGSLNNDYWEAKCDYCNNPLYIKS